MRKCILSAVCFFAVVLSGCCSLTKDDYNIVLLGDIHYDKIEFHQMPKFNPKVPWDCGSVDSNGVFLWRLHNKWMTESCGDSRQNYPLNARMWKEDVPQIIKRAAVNGAENNALYTFQLGDMIHGDCGNLALHKKNLQESLDYLKGNSSSPVLVACGNHDPRGPFGKQAWNEVMLPHFDKAAKNIQRKNTNFSVKIDKDLYYFHDAMNPDFEYLEKTLNENNDARYTFFVSHIPLFAMAKNHINEPLAENFDNLLKILEEHNAIIISGHTHWISLTQYRNNGRRIDQFVLNSTVRYPERDIFDPAKNISKDEFCRDNGKRKELWEKYRNKITVPLNTWGAGHAIMRVSDKGVFVDFYGIKSDKVYTYQLR
jgi:hypothetical protein